MAESTTPTTTSPGIDMAPTASLLQSGSPKAMYVYFLLQCCKNYFEVMRSDGDDFKMESATVALIAMCTSRSKREELWQFYITQIKDSDSKLYASVRVVGELVSYLSEVLELEEQSNGGLL
jgi:archaellin